ncbi:MAG: hypothetical protein HY961_06905 [Ignavibacteriae bacterium]|nr:hypothetical protein [Ignavibacteriota bacterium]
MSTIVFILLIVYVLGYIVSRPKSIVIVTKRRILVFASVLSIIMLSQTYYQVQRPPKVNYYETGWFGFIKYLNARFATNGNPNRIPLPENR